MCNSLNWVVISSEKNWRLQLNVSINSQNGQLTDFDHESYMYLPLKFG